MWEAGQIMYEICMATESDRNEILKLYKAQIGRESCPWTDHYPENDTIDFDLARNSLFVMKEEGRIIGTVSVDEDENTDNLECWSSELYPGGELSRLAVLPEEQGRHLAAELLKFGMKELKRRGFKSIHFLVNKHNHKAISAYSTLEFNIVGECYLYEQKFLCYEKEL